MTPRAAFIIFTAVVSVSEASVECICARVDLHVSPSSPASFTIPKDRCVYIDDRVADVSSPPWYRVTFTSKVGWIQEDRTKMSFSRCHEKDPGCKDVYTLCSDKQLANVCTDHQQWAYQNCRKHCSLCDVNIVVDTCTNVLNNCRQYGKSVCSQYAEWSVQNCMKYCRLCDCINKVSNCSEVGPSVCTNNASWARDNCKKYCSMCGTSTTTTTTTTTTSPTAATAECKDMGSFDCNFMNSMVQICTKDLISAKTYCPKYCKVCDTQDTIIGR